MVDKTNWFLHPIMDLAEDEIKAVKVFDDISNRHMMLIRRLESEMKAAENDFWNFMDRRHPELKGLQCSIEPERKSLIITGEEEEEDHIG